MLVLLAADHAGFPLKETLKTWLADQGYPVTDFGTNSADSVDYPDVVHPLAHRIELQQGTAIGLLVCGSGQGVCMTANKYPHLRAALAWNSEIAQLARAHNNANVLCLPGRFISAADAQQVLKTFLSTPFEGGRHERRVVKMTAGQ